MRIAITGSTGFLGRHLVDQLCDAHDLVCLSRSGSAPKGCTGLAVDVTTGEGLDKAFAKADVVVHAAGIVSHVTEGASKTWAVHVEGTKNVLAAARKKKVGRVVHVSTSGTIAVSNDPGFLGTENDPTPDRFISGWPYYRSKLYAEQEALSAADSGQDVVCLNPALLLGPGDAPGGASTHAVSVFLNSGVPVAPAGGISFVDVRDVASAIPKAIEHGRSGERYLLAGANLSFREFFDRLARITGRSQPALTMPQATRRALRWFPGWGQKNGIGIGVGPALSREDLELASHFWYADSTKARTELGWTPRGPNETLDDTVADLLSQSPR